MILIITNKVDYTTDFVILELKSRAIDFFRLNTEDFPQNLDIAIQIYNQQIEGYIKEENRIFNLNEIQSVWYRRPFSSLPSPNIEDSAAREFVTTESQETLAGLWRILPCFWVSHPDKIKIAESKPYQLKLAVDLGFTIPNTLITNSPEKAKSFYNDYGSVIYKPLRRGRITRSNSTHFIYTSLVQDHHIQKYIENVQLCPILFQPQIQKAVEIRVTIIKNKVFAVALHSQEIEQARYDWRRADTEKLRHTPHELPVDIQSKCISLVEKLGLAFGAIDMILTPDGEYIFLEINPNGQWAWIQEMCPDLDIREALIDILVNGKHDGQF